MFGIPAPDREVKIPVKCDHPGGRLQNDRQLGESLGRSIADTRTPIEIVTLHEVIRLQSQLADAM
jgi:hypothetical protein